MKTLICIDDGHGMTTPGKRTPFFPNTQTFMHENEFNRVVAEYLRINLERCGFNTLMVASTDVDTPLDARVNLANNAHADFFISIHANALTGIWGTQQGAGTYHYPDSVNGLKAATVIHKYLLQGTFQKDRKVQSANFYVLRETDMPSVLVECAFMDNLREAELLMSNAFRHECADEIAKGICEYFNVNYITTMTYENAINIVTEFSNTNKDYWISRRYIDANFANLMIKISKAIENVKR